MRQSVRHSLSKKSFKLKKQQVLFANELTDTIALIIKLLSRITDKFEEIEAKIVDLERLAEPFEND
jgi:hypothetical protein